MEKQFDENLIVYFQIFPAKTRVGIVTFSTSVKLEFNFNKYINVECKKRHSRHKVSTLILNLVVLQANFKGSSTHRKTSSPVLASN